VPRLAAEVEHDFDFWLPHSRSGLDGVQEVAFTLADPLRMCNRRWMPGWTSTISRRSFVFFNAHNDLLEEIAKYGLRGGCGSLMRERFQARDEKSLLLRFQRRRGFVADGTAAGKQHVPWPFRRGGSAWRCQSLHTNSMDEAWRCRPRMRR